MNREELYQLNELLAEFVVNDDQLELQDAAALIMECVAVEIDEINAEMAEYDREKYPDLEGINLDNDLD